MIHKKDRWLHNTAQVRYYEDTDTFDEVEFVPVRPNSAWREVRRVGPMPYCPVCLERFET